MDAVLIAPLQTSLATIAHTYLRGYTGLNLALVTSFCLLIFSYANGCSVHSLSQGTVVDDLIATRQMPPIPIIYTLLRVAQV